MKRRSWMIGRLEWYVVMVSTVTLVLATPTIARPIVPPPDDENAATSQSASKPDPLAGPRADDRRAAPPRNRGDEKDEADARRAGRSHRRRRAGPRDRDALGNRVRRRPLDRQRGRERSREGGRRGREGRGGPEDFGLPRDEMSPRMIDRVMSLLREELPQWYDRLADMREDRPEQFRRAMRRILPVVREYTSLREKHPELAETILEEFRIEGELRAMGREFREARGDEARQREIEREVVHLVQRQFELKMHRRVARLEEIERRLQREREKFQRDKEMLPQHVEDRVRQITRGDFRNSLRDRERPPRRERRESFDDRPRRRRHRRR